MARQILGKPLIHVASGGGGNSRLYRLADGEEEYAFKIYPPIAADGWDRQRVEWDALAFMKEQGVTCVPQLVGRSGRCALFHWVDGVPLETVNQETAQQMLDFLGQLSTLEHWPASRHAADACLNAGGAIQQTERRHSRLHRQGEGEGLHAFLDQWQRAATPILDVATRQLAHTWRPPLALLSPSDFGIHNALRQPHGQIIFLDFEYFGWDDPVKLLSDLLWHPAMDLSPPIVRQLHQGIRALRRQDEGFDQRFAALYPVFGLVWCLILLNPFLPEGWQRWATRQSRPALLAQRLAKARHYLHRLENIPHDGPG